MGALFTPLPGLREYKQDSFRKRPGRTLFPSGNREGGHPCSAISIPTLPQSRDDLRPNSLPRSHGSLYVNKVKKKKHLNRKFPKLVKSQRKKETVWEAGTTPVECISGWAHEVDLKMTYSRTQSGDSKGGCTIYVIERTFTTENK